MHKRIIVVDLEASGWNGYPIELGWSEVGAGAYESFLIRPNPSWISCCEWDPSAEDAHGVSFEMLDREGYDPDAVIFPFLKAIDGAIVISDAPEFDQFWLDQLFDASYLFTTKEGRVALQSIHSVFPKFDLLKFENETENRKKHRAGPDALALSNHLYSITSNEE